MSASKQLHPLKFRVQLSDFAVSGLPSEFGAIDAYVVFHFDYYVGSKDKFINRTTRKNAKAPQWTEVYEFDYEVNSSSQMKEKHLVLDLYDAKVMLDRLMGRVKIDIHTLATGPVKHSLPLRRDDGSLLGGTHLHFDCVMEEIRNVAVTLKDLTLDLTKEFALRCRKCEEWYARPGYEGGLGVRNLLGNRGNMHPLGSVQGQPVSALDDYVDDMENPAHIVPSSMLRPISHPVASTHEAQTSQLQAEEIPQLTFEVTLGVPFADSSSVALQHVRAAEDPQMERWSLSELASPDTPSTLGELMWSNITLRVISPVTRMVLAHASVPIFQYYSFSSTPIAFDALLHEYLGTSLDAEAVHADTDGSHAIVGRVAGTISYTDMPHFWQMQGGRLDASGIHDAALLVDDIPHRPALPLLNLQPPVISRHKQLKDVPATSSAFLFPKGAAPWIGDLPSPVHERKLARPSTVSALQTATAISTAGQTPLLDTPSSVVVPTPRNSAARDDVSLPKRRITVPAGTKLRRYAFFCRSFPLGVGFYRTEDGIAASVTASLLCCGVPDTSLFVETAADEESVKPLAPYSAIVHSVDATSPANGRVRPGDVLLAVDGKDVGGLSLEAVSNVLLKGASALKQAQLQGLSAPAHVQLEFATLAPTAATSSPS